MVMASGSTAKPRCFVVMGYEKKVDPFTSKVYDLDKSYNYIIKKAVERAGFDVIRSDTEMTPGTISRQMYQHLIDADLVVCDLTTLNVNAVFELGVRMALRPRATVVICAQETKIPFNLNQQRLFRYAHGGEVIDYGDVERAQDMLEAACRAAMASTGPDSLIYSLFNTELEPPRWRRIAQAAAGPSQATPPDPREFVWRAKQKKDWAGLIKQLKKLHDDAERTKEPLDPFFTQQWALATYKQRETKTSVELEDLLNARDILVQLRPEQSVDAETLGLWAAIHKRLSAHPERGSDMRRKDLDAAILSYRKGYVLRRDHYTGGNYASLMLRRALEFDSVKERAVRDRVEAEDTWAELIATCVDELDAPIPGKDVQLEREHRDLMTEQFWRTSTLAQAMLATRDPGYDRARARLNALQERLGEDWMVDSTTKDEDAMRRMLGIPVSAPRETTEAAS